MCANIVKKRNFSIVLSSLIAALLGSPAANVAAQAPISSSRPEPQMQAVLDQLAKLNPKPIETLTPAEARQQPSAADAVKALLKSQGKSADPEPVANVENRTIPGGEGDIPIRIYTPEGEGPFPVLVYWHGGGWVIATIDAYDASCRALANAAKCVVVSCHYRQAPEHPFPAAVSDALAAYQWVLQNAAEIGGDPARIAVAGESPGGNLAAVVAQQAAMKNLAAPVHQLLIYPVANHAFDTPSYKEHANAKPLNMAMMKWFWTHYVGEGEGRIPMASPLRAENLADLPPATIITADVDPLRSEGEAYAEKLKAAGVAVNYTNYEGVAHEFFGMGAVVDKAKEAVTEAAEGLQVAFEK